MKRRLSIHLDPHLDDWIRAQAEHDGTSINEQINRMLSLLMRKKEEHRKRLEIQAMQAKIEALRNKKATPEGVAPSARRTTVERKPPGEYDAKCKTTQQETTSPA